MWQWLRKILVESLMTRENYTRRENLSTVPIAKAVNELSVAPKSMNSAHLALLSKFINPNNPDVVGQPYWNAVLPAPIDVTLSLFRQQGWLVDSTWQEVFAEHHRVDDLKVLLRAHGLPVSGRKIDLV